MDEIVVRPKYSRQTSTQRKKRREPENDLLSTAFAAKLLVVVVFLSVFALCKAADTPATKFFVSKVKVVSQSNYDVNKYLVSFATAIGIKPPQNDTNLEKVSDDSTPLSQENNNNNTLDKKEELNQNIQNSSIGTQDNPVTDLENTENVENTSQIQILEDTQIKAIADKYSFITPIKGDIASPFGMRIAPLNGNTEFHSGIDIEANMGASIKAALGGEIVEVGSTPSYGNYIKIKHNDGINTIYAYCSILIAKKGDKVNQGDAIAKVGDTEGLSSSLHFEVWKDNKAVDPEKLLNYLNQ